MDIIFPVIITAGSVIAAILLIVFIVSISRRAKGYYAYEYDQHEAEKASSNKYETASDVEEDIEEEPDFLIAKRVARKISDDHPYGVIGVDALRGQIEGPWKSVIASIISANRGVSREHLGFAPVTQILNEISPTNKNVTINLEKDQLEDFLGYVKVLEASLGGGKKEIKGITPQQKYRMLQRAFEDKRDLDTTKEARDFSREVIRQEKLHRSRLLADEQLAKLESEVSGRTKALLEENPDVQEELDEFKEDLKGKGLSRWRRRRKVTVEKTA